MTAPPDTLSVLVMDDDEDVRFITDHMLRRLGFSVVLAPGGIEAIECYRKALAAESPFHAVILDINIHGGPGGLAVLERLKELDPRVNAFVSSGNPFDPVMVTPTAFGFIGALAKPLTTSSLQILLPHD